MTRLAFPAASRTVPLGLLTLLLFAPTSPELEGQTDTIRRSVTLGTDVAAREVQVTNVGQDRMNVAQARAALGQGGLTPDDSLYLQVLRLEESPEDVQTFLTQFAGPQEPIPFTIASEPQYLTEQSLPPGFEIAQDEFAVGDVQSSVFQWNQEWVVRDARGMARLVSLRSRPTLARQINPDGPYEGTIYTWVVDPSDPKSRLKLEPPFVIELIVEAGTAEPSRVEIEHTNLPLTPIHIRDANPTDSLLVHLVPSSGATQSVALRLRPRIDVSGPTPDEPLQGWGVETATINLRLVGASTDDPVMVSLNSASAHISPNPVAVGRNRPASATLRTKGTGSASYTVSSLYGEHSYDLAFVTPWRFLILVVVGGALGATVGLLAGKEPGWKRWAVATILGAVLPMAYFGLGINLTSLPLPTPPSFTEIAAIVVAFVAAGGVTATGKPDGSGH